MRVKRTKSIAEDVAVDIEEVNLSFLDSIIDENRGKKGNVIPLLQGIQKIYGYLPALAIKKVAKELGLKESDLYGVATFYSQFRLKPVGKFIVKVCHGTACHVQNANAVTEALIEFLGVKDGETTPDRLFTLESVACLGCCSLAPVMMIGDETYGKLTAKSVVGILTDIKVNEVK